MKRAIFPWILFGALVACNPANTAADVDLVGCIVKETEVDINAGMTAEATVQDVAVKCVTDVPTVISTLNANKKAMAALPQLDAGAPK